MKGFCLYVGAFAVIVAILLGALYPYELGCAFAIFCMGIGLLICWGLLRRQDAILDAIRAYDPLLPAATAIARRLLCQDLEARGADAGSITVAPDLTLRPDADAGYVLNASVEWTSGGEPYASRVHGGMAMPDPAAPPRTFRSWRITHLRLADAGLLTQGAGAAQS